MLRRTSANCAIYWKRGAQRMSEIGAGAGADAAWNVPEGRLAAIVDFTFNLGAGCADETQQKRS